MRSFGPLYGTVAAFDCLRLWDSPDVPSRIYVLDLIVSAQQFSLASSELTTCAHQHYGPRSKYIQLYLRKTSSGGVIRCHTASLPEFLDSNCNRLPDTIDLGPESEIGIIGFIRPLSERVVFDMRRIQVVNLVSAMQLPTFRPVGSQP